MKNLVVYDSSTKDAVSQLRGGGRIIQILKENLPDARFIKKLSEVNPDDSFLIPSWNPFSPPIVNKRISNKQYLIIFDTIPVKFPHSFPPGIRGKINLWRNKQALQNFDKIITISEHSKKDIVKYLGVAADKIQVVYPTVSRVFLDDQKNIDSRISNIAKDQDSKFQILNSKFCIYVGDVNWNKNLVNLAKAVKLANISCVFVGKPFDELKDIAMGGRARGAPIKPQRSEDLFGAVREQDPLRHHPWQREFYEFTKEIGDDKRFIFLGYVPDDELIELYQNAALNILVSRDEGFGYSYLESALQKCPSVLSNIDVFHETAESSALFADPENPNEIADMIIELYFDKDKRNELGRKAFERSKQFSSEEFKKQIESIVLSP